MNISGAEQLLLDRIENERERANTAEERVHQLERIVQYRDKWLREASAENEELSTLLLDGTRLAKQAATFLGLTPVSYDLRSWIDRVTSHLTSTK